MKPNSDLFALMSCGDKYNTQGFPVRIDDLVTCWHHGPQAIVVAALDEWYVECQTCPYHVNKGPAKLAAEIASSKHRQQKSSHIVHMYNPDGSLHRVFNGGGQLTLGDSEVTDT